MGFSRACTSECVDQIIPGNAWVQQFAGVDPQNAIYGMVSFDLLMGKADWTDSHWRSEWPEQNEYTEVSNCFGTHVSISHIYFNK